MDSEPPTYLTWALRPGTIHENPPIYFCPVDRAVEDQLIGSKNIQCLFYGCFVAVIFGESAQAPLF
jgi:hypothetical protein